VDLETELEFLLIGDERAGDGLLGVATLGGAATAEKQEGD
jgi:hypothetical protein